MTIVYLFSFISNASRYFANPKDYTSFDFSLFPISFAIVTCLLNCLGLWNCHRFSLTLCNRNEMHVWRNFCTWSYVHLWLLIRNFHSDPYSMCNSIKRKNNKFILIGITMGTYRLWSALVNYILVYSLSNVSAHQTNSSYRQMKEHISKMRFLVLVLVVLVQASMVLVAKLYFFPKSIAVPVGT